MFSFLGFKLHKSINVTAWVLQISGWGSDGKCLKYIIIQKRMLFTYNLLLHWASNSNCCDRIIESVSQEPFDSFMSSTQWFIDPVHEFQNYGLSVFWFHLTSEGRRHKSYGLFLWCFFLFELYWCFEPSLKGKVQQEVFYSTKAYVFRLT